MSDRLGMTGDAVGYGNAEFGKSQGRKDGGTAVGTGTTLAALGLVGGGVPGKRPDSGRLKDVAGKKTRAEATRHLVSATRGGIFGYREDAHHRFSNGEREKLRYWHPHDIGNHFERGTYQGKLKAESKIIPHLHNARVGSNVVLGTGAALATGGLIQRHRTKSTVRKDDEYKSNTAIAAGTTLAGSGAIGSRVLENQGRKWSKRSAQHILRTAQHNPAMGTYDIKRQKKVWKLPRRGNRVPDVVPHRSTGDILYNNQGIFHDKPVKHAVEMGHLRGQASQARYFARVYGNQARLARGIGAGGAALALAGVGTKTLQVKPQYRHHRHVEKAAPKRLPFLHPSARPFDASVSGMRQTQNRRQNKLILGVMGGKMRPAIQAGRGQSAGPQAPARVKAALSGKDYGETLGRLGRATRRQNKEFSALVHPLSGRVMDMRRGGPGNVGYGIGAVSTAGRARSRMAELADTARSPKVRARAKANLNGENKNLRGPAPVLVHNHPRFDTHYGIKGKHAVRSYPSTQDRMMMGALSENRHVVLSHAPDGPKGRKTKAVTTRVLDSKRGISAGTHERLAHQDNATVTKPIRRALFKDKDTRVAVGAAVAGSRKVANRTPKGKLTPYDQYHQQRTGNVKNARRGGIYTTESFLKVDTTMSEAEAHRLASRYDTRGPLPKTLSREQKMKAYEARYIASGGKQGEKWHRRAGHAEAVRNAALVGATASTAALLASRGKRTGPKMAKLKITPHRAETGAMGSAVVGGAAELYGEHARDRRASYANSPAGVAGSALSRMRAYTPGRTS